MKKFTCKMIPKNEELKTEEFDIEIKECCRERVIFKYVFLGAFVAFCMGMTIAMFAWMAHVNLYDPAIEYFRAMLGAVVVLALATIVCGTVIVCKYISVSARAKCQLESKVREGVAKKCAQDKNEKGINLKISKF